MKKPMKKSYKDEQKKFRELLRPKLLEGYRFNSFGNRQTRRQTAKRSGYFKRDKDGKTAWPTLRADPANNVQTLPLTVNQET